MSRFVLFLLCFAWLMATVENCVRLGKAKTTVVKFAF